MHIFIGIISLDVFLEKLSFFIIFQEIMFITELNFSLHHGMDSVET